MSGSQFQTCLPEWPVACLEQLDTVFNNQGYLSPDVVSKLCEQLNLNVGQLAEALLPAAKCLSIAPLSGFQVGAVGIGTNMNGAGIPGLYLGANFEIEGAPLTYTLHAEQSVMSLVLAHGDQLSALMLSTVPCGYCRQFLWEFCHTQTLPVMIPGHTTTDLSDLLPAAFGPLDLNITTKPPNAFKNLSRQFTSAQNIAAQAAEHNYAPYSNTKIGCAISYHSGVTYPGVYLENAAYNPSLSPLWVALNLTRASEADFSVDQLESLYVVEMADGLSLQAQLQAEWLAVAADKPIQYQLSGTH